MLEKWFLLYAVCLRGEVYVLGTDGYRLESVNKYSPLTKSWSHVTDIPDKRYHFFACAFIDKIYVFGGFEPGTDYLNSCLQFDAKLLEWKEVAKMNEAKVHATSTIYEGNIVVSGGIDINRTDSNTVESYDAFADTWTRMPNMINRRCLHSLVPFKNKLFAIGGTYYNTNCEVFDKVSNMFVTFETPKFISSSVRAVSIGSKIFVFQDDTKIVLCYDVDKDEWSEEFCEATENICYYSAVKMPSY